MKIVINIDEYIYEQIMADSEVYVLDNEVDRILIENAIYNGTPLPEHHGRLIDADDIMNDIKNDINEMTNIGIGVDGQYLWEKLNDAIYNVPTIIEGSESE